MTQNWNTLSKETELSKVVSTILKNRGIESAEEQELFLNPPQLSYWVERLSDDFKTALKNSRDLIQEFVDAGKPILIHGDYDVDGVSATAIMFSAIREELGHENVFAFVPNRFNHGYGLSKDDALDHGPRHGGHGVGGM